MSNLALHKGNFIAYTDAVFIGDGQKSASSFTGINELVLEGDALFGVLPSSNNQVHVKIQDGEDVTVHQQGDRLVIKSKSSGSVTFSSNGCVSNISGGNISMINGRVFVNGEEISPNSNSKPKPQPKITIFAPSGLILDADLKGVATLASKVPFPKAYASISGSSDVGIAGDSVTLKISGTGNAYVVVRGGALKAKVSGSGSVKAKGVFGEVDASISGMGSITTEGECMGDYEASVSGMGNIMHKNGLIRGRKREKVSGMGQIDI